MKTLLVMLPIITLMLIGCGETEEVSDNYTDSRNYNSSTIGTLIYVPPGSFQRDETPTNISVMTTAFRISQNEITQDQFNSLTGLSVANAWPSVANGPANEISWYHTLFFCNKLSQMENLTSVYSINDSTDPAAWGTIPTTDTGTNTTWDEVATNWNANGYRLPTRMEWMWAAMGADIGAAKAYGYPISEGTVYTTGYAKSFAGSTGNNSIDDYVWYSGNSSNTTHPIGTKLPNELSLHDMSGNVWEWLWDWEGGSPSGTLTDYKGPTTGSRRRIIGGSMAHIYNYAAISFVSGSPNIAADIGFRVVRL